MAHPQRPRLLVVLLLLSLALGWPTSGSAPGMTDGSTQVAGAAAPDDCVGCDGCAESSGGSQTCPTSMCPAVPAIVPAFDLGWPGTRATVLAAADERGRGQPPDPQTPPPRTTLLA